MSFPPSFIAYSPHSSSSSCNPKHVYYHCFVFPSTNVLFPLSLFIPSSSSSHLTHHHLLILFPIPSSHTPHPSPSSVLWNFQLWWDVWFWQCMCLQLWHKLWFRMWIWSRMWWCMLQSSYRCQMSPKVAIQQNVSFTQFQPMSTYQTL